MFTAASLAVAAPVPKSLRKQADVADIVGLWVKQPGDKTGWYFNADGSAGLGDPVSRSGCQAVYTVDLTQTPKHLNWSQDGGRSWYLAVYEIENDVLRINFGSGGSGARPTQIGPNTGSQFETGTRSPNYRK
jgi:hypothetical protein